MGVGDHRCRSPETSTSGGAFRGEGPGGGREERKRTEPGEDSGRRTRDLGVEGHRRGKGPEIGVRGCTGAVGRPPRRPKSVDGRDARWDLRRSCRLDRGSVTESMGPSDPIPPTDTISLPPRVKEEKGVPYSCPLRILLFLGLYRHVRVPILYSYVVPCLYRVSRGPPLPRTPRPRPLDGGRCQARPFIDRRCDSRPY